MLTWRTAAPWRWSPRRRVGRRPHATPITMCGMRYGYLPACFRQQGLTHRIARVERSWEWRGQFGLADRRYFAVRCANGQSCTLFQDLRAGTWHIEW
ncbi:MAG: hypothetical protein OHK0015_20910 [Chloroflexi bacterium OHK40]